ncbi:MAG: hypothetical protein WKF31_02450 [Thermoleophilaceae bacterium]
MPRKMTPVLVSAGAGALIALTTNVVGLGDLAATVIAGLVLTLVVAVGTPLAFGITPLAVVRRRRGRAPVER